MRISRRNLPHVAPWLALCAFFASVACAQVTPTVPSAAQIDQVLAGISRGRFIGQVAVSPDGKRLAWLQGRSIRVAPLDDLGQSQPITAAAPGQSCGESDFAWSPDSQAVAFFSDCGDPGGQSAGQADLYISGLDGGTARRLTSLHGYVAAPAFSPDGKRIAFLYVEDATRPAGALAAQNLPSGVIGEDQHEVQRIAVVAVSPSGQNQPEQPAGDQPSSSQAPDPASLFSFVTPAGLHVYEFDWSPDSRSLAYIAADPPGENNWWVAKLYTQSVGTPTPDSWTEAASISPPDGGSQANTAAAPGAVVLRLHSNPEAILSPADVSGPLHGLQIAEPRWSPDGKSIAFIGGLMSDQGVTGGDIWTVPAAGGEPRDLTAGRSTTAEWIAWDGNGHIFSSEVSGGDSRLVRLRVPLSGDEARFDPPVFSIQGTAGTGAFDHSLSATADRSLFLFQASSFNRPPEIYAAKAIGAARAAAPSTNPSSGFAGLTQLTHFNEGLKPSWGESISLDWANDKFHIQGWLMLPRDYDPAKKYPMIVEVHGGPAASVLSRWSTGELLSPEVFSDLGYFVLQPNPRGSYGQGETFTEANRKDFGYGDLSDILAGVDAVLAKYSVDPGRIGITGWSYGGFMTMFAVTRTHRFRAGVAGAGISDWLSYYGENSIDQWMIPYFGASVYDDPQVYAKSSAIDFIKRVTTPTLILVGDRDGECPAPQSFEFWHALRDLHVPTQLVVYPDEGHGLSNPAHRRDVLQRSVDWFAQYMP